MTVEDLDPHTIRITVQGAALFSNYIGLKHAIDTVDPTRNVEVDFSRSHLVDHSTMQYMHETVAELAHAGRSFTIAGLEHHRADSDHPAAARRLVG